MRLPESTWAHLGPHGVPWAPPRPLGDPTGGGQRRAEGDRANSVPTGVRPHTHDCYRLGSHAEAAISRLANTLSLNGYGLTGVKNDLNGRIGLACPGLT